MGAQINNASIILDGSENAKKGIWPTSFPLWLVGLYVFLFIVRPWEKLFPWLGLIHFERIYFIFMLIVTALSNAKQSLPRNTQNIAVCILLITIGLSGVFAYDSSLFWAPFYVVLTLVVFYFVMLLVIRQTYDLIFIIICYIVTMTLYLAKAQWEFFVNGQHRYTMGVIRMVGIEHTTGGPNDVAMSIVVSLPMLVFLWSNRGLITYTWPDFYKKWFPRSLIIYVYLVISSILLTNSRSGMVSCVFFVFLISLFRGQNIGKKFGYILISIVLLMTIWFIMPEAQKGRLRTVWEPESGPVNAKASAEGRIEGLKAGIAMFNQSPILGVGIGSFIKNRVEKVDGVPLNAHNLIGQVLGETGALGSIAFMFMIFTTIRNTRLVRSMAKIRPSPVLDFYEQLAFAIRDSIFVLFFSGLFGHNFYRFNWFWLGAFSVLTVQVARKKLDII